MNSEMFKSKKKGNAVFLFGGPGMNTNKHKHTHPQANAADGLLCCLICKVCREVKVKVVSRLQHQIIFPFYLKIHCASIVRNVIMGDVFCSVTNIPKTSYMA